MNYRIAMYILLACAVCTVVAIWSPLLAVCVAIVFAFIAYAVSGREFEGYI